MTAPVLINGKWREARASGTFRSENPATAEPLADEYPISTWDDCEAALEAAETAFKELRAGASQKVPQFLDAYAAAIESHVDELAAIANTETGLPISPRLKDVELARTIDQLRQAVAAAREGSWACRQSKPKTSCGAVTRQLVQYACLGRIISHLLMKGLLAAILPRPFRLAIR